MGSTIPKCKNIWKTITFVTHLAATLDLTAVMLFIDLIHPSYGKYSYVLPQK